MKKPGWYGHPYEHDLARQGIKTKRESVTWKGYKSENRFKIPETPTLQLRIGLETDHIGAKPTSHFDMLPYSENIRKFGDIPEPMNGAPIDEEEMSGDPYYDFYVYKCNENSVVIETSRLWNSDTNIYALAWNNDAYTLELSQLEGPHITWFFENEKDLKKSFIALDEIAKQYSEDEMEKMHWVGAPYLVLSIAERFEKSVGYDKSGERSMLYRNHGYKLFNEESI